MPMQYIGLYALLTIRLCGFYGNFMMQNVLYLTCVQRISPVGIYILNLQVPDGGDFKLPNYGRNITITKLYLAFYQ